MGKYFGFAHVPVYKQTQRNQAIFSRFCNEIKGQLQLCI